MSRSLYRTRPPQQPPDGTPTADLAVSPPRSPRGGSRAAAISRASPHGRHANLAARGACTQADDWHSYEHQPRRGQWQRQPSRVRRSAGRPSRRPQPTRAPGRTSASRPAAGSPGSRHAGAKCARSPRGQRRPSLADLRAATRRHRLAVSRAESALCSGPEAERPGNPIAICDRQSCQPGERVDLVKPGWRPADGVDFDRHDPW